MSEKDLSLEGRVVLVAGASRGIGEAAAKRMARNGAMVICSSRKIADCERVAEEIKAEGGKARAMVLQEVLRTTVRSLSLGSRRVISASDGPLQLHRSVLWAFC